MGPGYQRYLRLLGIEGRPEGLDGLRTLVRRHLWRVPFENISKLLLYDREGAGRPLSLNEFLDGVEFRDLGGTCYTANGLFAELLREVGYQADLLGADMSNLDVHTCIRVRIDDASYHVDVGFAAPFREPIRLDDLPARIDEGRNRYLLDHDGSGLRLTMPSGGENAAGYFAHDPPRPRSYFDGVLLQSFAPAAHFMQHLRISRIFDDYSLDLLDDRMWRHEAGETSEVRFDSLADLKAAVAEEFQMPRCPVEEAAAVLQGLTARTQSSAG